MSSSELPPQEPLESDAAAVPQRSLSPMRGGSGFGRIGLVVFAVLILGGLAIGATWSAMHQPGHQQQLAAIASPEVNPRFSFPPSEPPLPTQAPNATATPAASPTVTSQIDPAAQARVEEAYRQAIAAANAGNTVVPPPSGAQTPPPNGNTQPQSEGETKSDVILVSGGVNPKPAEDQGSSVSGPLGGNLPPIPAPVGPSAGPQSFNQLVVNEHTAFDSPSGRGRSKLYAQGKEEDPVAAIEIFAGTPVEGQLDDAISTSIPGMVYGHLTGPVRNSLDPHTVVWPAYTRLVGRYDTNVVPGDGRIQVAWDYLILPDGRTYDLGGMQAAQVTGENGLAAHVDDHRGRIFTTAFLTAVLSAGTALAAGPASGALQAVNMGQVAGGAASNAIAQTGNTILQRDVQMAPTLTVPRGRVFVVRMAQTVVNLQPWDRAQ